MFFVFPFRLCVVSEHPSGGGLTLTETDTQETKRKRERLLVFVCVCVYLCVRECACERDKVEWGRGGG